MTSLVDGIAQHLANAGLGAYSPGAVFPKGQTPIAVAGFPKSEGVAIVVTTYPGGPEPDSRNGWEYPRLQVKVRSTDPLEAIDLERTTYDVLQALQVSLPNGWWLQDCYALQSDAEPLGRDDNGRWEYARNYQLTTQPPTAG